MLVLSISEESGIISSALHRKLSVSAASAQPLPRIPFLSSTRVGHPSQLSLLCLTSEDRMCYESGEHLEDSFSFQK